MQYTSGRPFDEEENRRQLLDCIEKYDTAENRFWVWAITLKDTNDFIGTCASVPFEDGVEIGYRFLETHFGKGYGTEICNGLIDFLVSENREEHIYARADSRNHASVRILERSKFQFADQLVDKDGNIERRFKLPINWN